MTAMQSYHPLQEEFAADYPSDDDDVQPKVAGTHMAAGRPHTASRTPPGAHWGQGRSADDRGGDRGRGRAPPVAAKPVIVSPEEGGYFNPVVFSQGDQPLPYPSSPQRPVHEGRTFQNDHISSQTDPSQNGRRDGYYDDETRPPSRGFSYIPNGHFGNNHVQSRPGDGISRSNDFNVQKDQRASQGPGADRTVSQSHETSLASHPNRTSAPFDSVRTSDSQASPDVLTQHTQEDLANLEFLNNDILLQRLQKRFSEQQPYTYLGDSLVAVNPCKPVDIYSQEYHEKYRDLRVRSSEPAHIYWVAAQVHRNLITTGSSQCVVVGGDSGAGKTESTKFILNHLVHIGTASKATHNADRELFVPDVVEKLEKVNPILEIFGNASTVLNENSSRFGKLVELEYDEQGILITARLECFILEKFRVTSRSPLEKNFHVFYALFAGMTDDSLAELGLEMAPESYRILKPEHVTDGIFRSEGEEKNYSQRYGQMKSMLPDVGFTKEEIAHLLEILSAILLISNVEFEYRDPDLDETLEMDGVGESCLERAVEVLGLDDDEEFKSSLLTVNMEVKGEKMEKQKTPRQARDGRDALARELYSILFYGIIDKLNHNLRSGNKNTSTNRNQCIRLLDISGFENVAGHNGFEQFIINATNERLHQYFLQHTFRHELQEYKEEGLAAVDVAFTDNDDIIDLIFEKPEGLIPLLEDEVATNGKDEGWLNKCRHRSKPSSRFQAKAHTAFSLQHYAGKVGYTAEGFVTKNSDTLPHNLREVVQRSDNVFIRDYFTIGSDAAAALHKSGRASVKRQGSMARRHALPTAFSNKEGGTSKRTGKLSGRFTDQYLKSLSGMMRKLKTATPVFVRCIKPNTELQAGRFDSEVVRMQLQSSGLLEVTKIRKEGYPIRILFKDFVKRYKDLLDGVDVSNVRRQEELRQTCKVILSTAGVSGHQMGHSKVFLKIHHRDQLENAVDKKLKEREERERQERERQESERAEMERAEKQRSDRKEDDVSSTLTDPSFAFSDSGFASSQSNAGGGPHDKPGTNIDHPGTGIADAKTEEDKEKEEEEEKKKKEKKKKEGLGNQPAYNIFRLTERDFENSTEFEMKIRRCTRLILYILIFSFILVGGVVARICLVWLSSRQLKDQERSAELIRLLDRDKRSHIQEFQAGLTSFRLLICQLLPLLLAWLSCLFKIFFGRKDWPSLRALMLVTLLDCAGVVGRSVFLFKVLPSTDVLTAVVLGTGVCQVPAVLKMISLCLLGNTSLRGDATPGRWSRIRHYLYFPLVALAMLVQLAVVPLLYFSNDIISAVSNSNLTLRLPDLWALVIAVLCSSVGWWENFAYGKVRTHKSSSSSSKEKSSSHSSDHHHRKLQMLSVLRIEMGRIRQASFVYTGPAQMVVLVTLFFAFNDGDVDLFDQIDILFSSFGAGFSNTQTLTTHFSVYGLMYMQIAGTFISTFLAGIACRLYMQRMGFALPVQLVAPACMALAVGCTPSNLAHWYDLNCVTADLTEVHVLFVLVMGIAVWLSTVVINMHVWEPEVERTAKMEKLFVFPHRDPIFPDLNLQCRRRQDKQENAERNRRHKKLDGHTKEGVERPTVYICATMWHEIRQEMLQLLKSLFRVDFDVYTRKKAQSQFDLLEEYSDLYDPEIHIIFDDAFETDAKSKQRVLNSWVKQFIEVMPEAMGSVAKRNLDLKPPTKISTPYGGQLLWVLPGGTKMYVHLKDKDRIRHRKRWSQILYLYYLLGFRLMKGYKTVDDALKAANSKKTRRRKHRVRKNTSLLNNISSSKVRQADNIFIMTLDGDVDFRPEAVRLLLDRMKKNKNVAAVCGRIHPIGDGPMVWYQKFEYAVGHWLQKAAEHVFGCVLCCPGCFSLFRGSALMDDNVMRMYTTEPTEAIHFIQYEQGEDRWLCTLLLQQGWKIEYCAGADALTFAPETFHDFYIQRRRWSPSTMANIVDLISSWRITVKMNDNISIIFMLYQFLLMASSILAPGLVVYMIAGSYTAVLELSQWEAYLLSVVPVFLYVLLCLKAKTATQINVAAIMSAVYAIVMLLVTIGTIINVATADILSPDVLFLITVAVIFIVAGFIHPNELFCLFHGILYYITVPSTFVFLTVFFLCNLNEVSWGTREGPKKVDPAAEQGAQQPVQEKGRLYKFFEKLGLAAIVQDMKSFVQQMMGVKQEVQQQLQNNSQQGGGSQNPENPKPQQPEPTKTPPPVPPKPKIEPKVEPDRTYWARELDIPNSKEEQLKVDEEEFWRFLIDEYLIPLKAKKEQQEKIKEDLLSARNNVVFAYMLLNLMFTLVLLQLRLQMDKLKDTFFIAGKYEPVSTVSLGVFSLLLLTQFSGMLGHRWSTFMHLIASTRITWFNHNEERDRALTAIEEAQKLTSAGAEGDIDMMNPDYSDDDETGDDVTMGPSTVGTPRMSAYDLTTLVEESGGEEPPDYTDSEGEEETQLGDSVQYDSVFDRRFRTVRRHIEKEQQHPARAPLYQKNHPAAAGRTRPNIRQYERRKSLYMSTRGAPWGRKNSIFNV